MGGTRGALDAEAANIMQMKMLMDLFFCTIVSLRQIVLDLQVTI